MLITHKFILNFVTCFFMAWTPINFFSVVLSEEMWKFSDWAIFQIMLPFSAIYYYYWRNRNFIIFMHKKCKEDRRGNRYIGENIVKVACCISYLLQGVAIRYMLRSFLQIMWLQFHCEKPFKDHYSSVNCISSLLKNHCGIGQAARTTQLCIHFRNLNSNTPGE